jgi:hypothetical protein
VTLDTFHDEENIIPMQSFEVEIPRPKYDEKYKKGKYPGYICCGIYQ